MKAPLALLLAAIPLAACTNAEPTPRPRLLAGENARIGQLSGLDGLATQAALSRQGEWVSLRLTACNYTPKVSGKPRLVIGEPACIFGSNVDPNRIDRGRID